MSHTFFSSMGFFYLAKKNMNLEDQVMTKLKEAMKAKDTIALEALRAIKSELLLAKTAVDSSFSEEKETALLQKLIKQRKEAAEQFSANNRTELAEKELAQAEVILSFLPAQLSAEELEKELKLIVSEIGATGPKEMGKVMAAIPSNLAARTEGKLIAQTVKKILSNL